MNDLDRAYRSRLVTHEELIGRMKPGDALSFGTWMGQPHGVMRTLEEGIALRAADIDIVHVHGYGFPAYRGGPMWYADTVGLKQVYERVRQFEQRHGDLWTPALLLKRLAESGKTFADRDREGGSS